jgi:hypothetical protein
MSSVPGVSAQRPPDALPPLGGLAVEPVRDRPRALIYWVLSSLMVAEEQITNQVLRFGRCLRHRGRGHLPLDPAGRRGAPHAVLRALPRRRRRRTLVNARKELVAHPDDLAAKVRFVTIYHLILEATLGLLPFGSSPATSSARVCCRASSRATRRSATTRPITSATASGSCAKPCATARRHRRRPAEQSFRSGRAAVRARRVRGLPLCAKGRAPVLPDSCVVPRSDTWPDSSLAATHGLSGCAIQRFGLTPSLTAFSLPAAQNQRARRLEANSTFSATSPSEGGWKALESSGPPRKSTSTRATRPNPNSM